MAQVHVQAEVPTSGDSSSCLLSSPLPVDSRLVIVLMVVC